MKLFIIKLLVASTIGMGAVGAEPKILDIDWGSVGGAGSGGVRMAGRSQSLPESLVSKIKDILLPIYMPSASVQNTRIQIVSSRNFYTITIPLKGASLFISGDRTYQQDVASNEALKGVSKVQDIDFIRAEGMVNSDFNRHGANYSLSIECMKPDEDVRCTKTDYLQQVYRDLIVVGGKS